MKLNPKQAQAVPVAEFVAEAYPRRTGGDWYTTPCPWYDEKHGDIEDAYYVLPSPDNGRLGKFKCRCCDKDTALHPHFDALTAVWKEWTAAERS